MNKVKNNISHNQHYRNKAVTLWAPATYRSATRTSGTSVEIVRMLATRNLRLIPSSRWRVRCCPWGWPWISVPDWFPHFRSVQSHRSFRRGKARFDSVFLSKRSMSWPGPKNLAAATGFGTLRTSWRGWLLALEVWSLMILMLKRKLFLFWAHK